MISLSADILTLKLNGFNFNSWSKTKRFSNKNIQKGSYKRLHQLTLFNFELKARRLKLKYLICFYSFLQYCNLKQKRLQNLHTMNIHLITFNYTELPLSVCAKPPLYRGRRAQLSSYRVHSF